MSTKFYKNEKFQKVVYPILYFLTAIAFIISGSFIFYRTYYSNVYVSGSSMSPTLMGGNNGQRHHYGISDNHAVALRNLKRFDVVITYYPNSWLGGDEDTTYKIKRVWGFPGETITMSFENDTYTFEATIDNKSIYKTTATITEKTYENLGTLRVASFSEGKRSFDVNSCSRYLDENGQFVFNAPLRTTFTVKLDSEKKEYFLMGDNWTSSSDSYSHINTTDRVKFNNLQGRVVMIQGTALVKNGELVDKHRIRNMYYF